MKKLLLFLSISLLASTASAKVDVHQFRVEQYDYCMNNSRTPNNARKAGDSKHHFCNCVAWEVFLRAHNVKKEPGKYVEEEGKYFEGYKFSYKEENLRAPSKQEVVNI